MTDVAPGAAPSLTVLMPVYNCRDHVSEAIRSILEQSYEDYEFLILDDGSTDGTLDVVREHQDRRVRIVTSPHQGLIGVLNDGLRLARGTYVARMDGDDIAHPERLRLQIEYLRTHPRAALVGGSVAWRAEAGYVSRAPTLFDVDELKIKWRLLFTNQFAHAAVVFKRAVALSLGGYSPADVHAEDYGLWSRLALGHEVGNVGEIVVTLRRWGGRISQHHQAAMKRTIVRVSGESIAAILGTAPAPAELRALQAVMCGGLEWQPRDVSTPREESLSWADLQAFRRLALRLMRRFCAYHGVGERSAAGRWIRSHIARTALIRAYGLARRDQASGLRERTMLTAATSRTVVTGAMVQPGLAASRLSAGALTRAVGLRRSAPVAPNAVASTGPGLRT